MELISCQLFLLPTSIKFTTCKGAHIKQNAGYSRLQTSLRRLSQLHIQLQDLYSPLKS